ncbi:hypothetical protein AGR8A_pTi20123 [Agrobacterium fabrum str. J-07]|nr:hypothetical protein AGR8A_pTi20123 [Agrobacterium fabrum str. J-07]
MPLKLPCLCVKIEHDLPIFAHFDGNIAGRSYLASFRRYPNAGVPNKPVVLESFLRGQELVASRSCSAVPI